ncbi:MAG: hypothetical protein PHT84_04720 [Candidatus Pacebacteria bacterium]|nr:hypothetical protein [Candidatus Paceibacterota bacterium]
MSNLLPTMEFKRKEHLIKPLAIFPVNTHYIIGIYQGSITKYDILIKYRQKNNDKWSRIRTPKHIHWAVDIMLKMHSSPRTTTEFLDFLLQIWGKTIAIKTDDERDNILKIDNLLELNKEDISIYNELGNHGEYSIKFLVLLARLLMIQEKTNLDSAYMFKELLEELKKNQDIFSIISKATHNGR